MSDADTGSAASPAPASAHLVERAAALLRADARLRDTEDALSDIGPPHHVTASEPPRPIRDPVPPAALTPARPEPEAITTDGGLPTNAKQPPALDIAALQRAGLMLTGERSRIAEEYRISVTRALRALRGSRAGRAGTANLMMVTSARPGEGKSFSALNLAASIAQNRLADVLLIDLDSKPRCLSATLGLIGRAGLLDLATSAATGDVQAPEALIARTAIEGLSFLPVGARRPGVEGAITRAVGATLERLSRRLPRHVIVLDTAPCLSTNDPSTLAGMIGEVLLVVEAERTQRSEVEAALDLLKAATNVTLVLNKVKVTQRHSFGSSSYLETSE